VHLILLGSAYLKYQKRFFSDLVGVDTEFLVSKQIEAQEGIVNQCMDCAWHDSTPDTRQLHLEMELLLVEPDCEISLSQLVRERKLDLIMYASANEIAERLSSLINPHCIGYFFKERDKYAKEVAALFALDLAKEMRTPYDNLAELNVAIGRETQYSLVREKLFDLLAPKLVERWIQTKISKNVHT
jgi:hypothetical protein